MNMSASLLEHATLNYSVWQLLIECSLLFDYAHDVTSHLRQIQTYAARVMLRIRKSVNISTHLKSLQ